jgi:hypothetical protein
MSYERQPARLAVINMRNQLDIMMKKEESKTSSMSSLGLLAPRQAKKEENQNSESARVLKYMKQIRTNMSV